jgi:hypothetical protein
VNQDFFIQTDSLIVVDTNPTDGKIANPRADRSQRIRPHGNRQMAAEPNPRRPPIRFPWLVLTNHVDRFSDLLEKLWGQIHRSTSFGCISVRILSQVTGSSAWNGGG